MSFIPKIKKDKKTFLELYTYPFKLDLFFFQQIKKKSIFVGQNFFRFYVGRKLCIIWCQIVARCHFFLLFQLLLTLDCYLAVLFRTAGHNSRSFLQTKIHWSQNTDHTVSWNKVLISFFALSSFRCPFPCHGTVQEYRNLGPL